MACRSCSTSDGGVPKGCKSNGSCGTGGCSNKLEVFDWLSNMQPSNPADKFNWVEVRFKNSRKEFYNNKSILPLHVGDLIAVEGTPGHDIGTVSMTGELVRLQMRKIGFNHKTAEGRTIYRKARENDIQKWKEAIDKENGFMMHCRKISRELKLEMKCSDVESQGDGSKATFYYTSEGRVDFRELIKILARDLKVRIEMRQIGFRQEAGRLGGIGVCGRELCCSTWIRDFRSVTTSAARYQQLSINPQKLAGQCGKLKCCLNYELDSYMDALADFPNTQVKLKTKIGDASHFKTDIFKKQVSYMYDSQPGVIITLDISAIHKILKMNKDGVLPDDLQSMMQDDAKKNAEPKKKEFANVLDEMNLSRFDNANKKPNNNNNKKKKKKKKPHGNNNKKEQQP